MKNLFNFLKSSKYRWFYLVLLFAFSIPLNSASANDEKKCDKITPITMFFHYRDRMAWTEDLPIVKYIEKQTCTKIKNVAPKYASKSHDVLNLHIASRKLADIVGSHNFRQYANKYGVQGAFMPLDTLIDKYAPHIKKVLNDNPSSRLKITAADGHIYYLPYFTPPKVKVGRAYFIRKDWLDKLNLKAPTTVQEVETVLKAFRDKDPNGNGKKDEIPYCGRHWQEAIRLVNLFGSRTSGSDYYFNFYLDKTNKVHYPLIEENFKRAYKELISWYKQGLIDKEIFTRGKRSREILFSQNNCGLLHDWIASTTSFNDAMQSKIPGFKLIAIDPPKNINGLAYEEHARELVRKDGWGMAKSTKDPLAIIKFMDWFYSEEGSLANNYGIPNVTYNMINGVPTFTKEVLSKTAIQDYLYKMGIQAPLGYVMDFRYEYQMVSDENKKIYDRYKKFLLPQYPGVSYNKKEQRLYDRSWTLVNSGIVPEYLQKWMLGSADIDKTWDEYIKKVKNAHFFELINATQQAYNRTYNNK